jgi:tripartite-type tricarboxylate transporter receptor subunit TctC
MRVKAFLPAVTVLTLLLTACSSSARQNAGQRSEQAQAATGASFNEQAVADFYRGKTIRIVVGFGPGGAFDVYSRLLSKHMPQYVPGNPTMVVENRPGAASAVAANLVYSVEPKDGTVIGSFNESLAMQQLMEAEGIQFDAGKFNWLGSSVDTATTCLVRSDLGVNSFQDMLGRELAFGSTGPGTPTQDGPAILNAALGTRLRIVSGYEGIAAIHLAMESRELDGYCVSFDSVQIVARRMLDANPREAKIVVVFGPRTPDNPWMRGVPTAESLAQNDRARQLIRAVHVASQVSKPFALAPEVPPDRVAALRKAYTAAFADPAFIEDARAAGLEVSPSDGEKVTKVMQDLLATPSETTNELKSILK